ncbi:alpha/beta hydrolase fold domain-containing protein [Penicillium pulvis]|uniref:alpha/beta hydrolase fold domain-containing protein n=1 Tax=Penicillium pulvis TaxID=1562058 RepID=UPI0025483A3D|nr:alpha/beta hydrolase fold domain-containing protein [Penicillium pulvis]KAJ5786607.1 alpha/beta hydrolase fold domain-containing protein [Penicillium pulvis]
MDCLSEYSDTLTLPSGRILAWKLYGGTLQEKGAEKPAIVFYFHGYPGCSVEATLIPVELLQKSNIRCIAPDRPGMNMSTHYDERRILDWPTDVLAIADHLGVSRFFVLGVSGGGPYALACAYSVPRDRLQGVAVVSSMYPTTFSTEGMLPELKVLLAAGAWLPRIVTSAVLDLCMGRAGRNKDPKVLEAAVDKAMEGRPEAERTAWKNERVRVAAIESVRGAFRQGGRPSATELMILCDWGFHLNDIAGERVRIWHGKLDRNVPVRMAEQAAELMPEAKTHFFENEGHLSSSANHISEVLADLISQ